VCSAVLELQDYPAGADFEEYEMSKRNNVNPGQYKVAGRERQGENLIQSQDKQAFATQEPQKQQPDRPPVREEYPGPQETSDGQRIDPGSTHSRPATKEERSGGRQRGAS
jgi:hypothetical protein